MVTNGAQSILQTGTRNRTRTFKTGAIRVARWLRIQPHTKLLKPHGALHLDSNSIYSQPQQPHITTYCSSYIYVVCGFFCLCVICNRKPIDLVSLSCLMLWCAVASPVVLGRSGNSGPGIGHCLGQKLLLWVHRSLLKTSSAPFLYTYTSNIKHEYAYGCACHWPSWAIEKLIDLNCTDRPNKSINVGRINYTVRVSLDHGSAVFICAVIRSSQIENDEWNLLWMEKRDGQTCSILHKLSGIAFHSNSNRMRNGISDNIFW